MSKPGINITESVTYVEVTPARNAGEVVKEIVEIIEVGVPGPSGASATAGAVFITDVQPTSGGTVGNKQYVAGTIPANIDLTDADTDVDAVTVYVIAEGGGANEYTPSVTVDGNTVTNLVQDSNDKRYYTGSYAITVSTTRVVQVSSSNGGTDSVLITRLGAGPAITAFTLGAYPGSQTEVKEDDVVSITGTVENAAASAAILNFGAAKSGTINLGAADSGGVGFKSFTGTITVSGATGTFAARAEATNTFGTTGATFDSTNTLVLNQTYPTVNFVSTTYPATQNAVKDSETADVNVTASAFDIISYSSPNFSIPSPTAYAASKTITRTSGDYVNTGTNYSVSATRTANDATTVVNVLVVIQHVAPTASISISGSPARLRSSPSGEDYVVTITANQSLQNIPSLTAGIGTWQGSWAGTGPYTRTLRIVDADAKGATTFSGLVLPGLANRDGSTITSGAAYTCGGFTNRTLTYAAFSQFEAIGTSVLDINKTVASYTGSSSLNLRNDLNNAFQAYSISNNVPVYDATGDQLFLNDQAFTGSNTTGTLQADIEETE